MLELTRDNHFQYGYNKQLFNFRTSIEDQWQVRYGPCTRLVKSFKEECYEAARYIRETNDGKLTVLFSGGSDSEVVVRAFIDQGISVDIAICRFKYDLNNFDIVYATKYCDDIGLRYHMFDLDIEYFFQTDALIYAERTGIKTPEMCSTMWLADQVDGLPIIGSGECLLVKELPHDYIPGISAYITTKWALHEKEAVAGWYRHFMLQNRKAVPGFFQYTAELMLSYLMDNTVVDLVNDRIIGKTSTITSKLGLYQKYFPLENRMKYTGFEKIQPELLETRRILHEKIPHTNQIFLTEYNSLVKMLNGN